MWKISERTKSVEAPNASEYVSPSYLSLKNDANVRPEVRHQLPGEGPIIQGRRTQYRVLDEIIIRVVELYMISAPCRKSSRAEIM